MERNASRRGALIALLCAAALGGALFSTLSASAQDSPAASPQAPSMVAPVQDATPADPPNGTGPDGRDCPKHDGGAGAGEQQAPESGGTSESPAPADSTAL